MPAFSRRAARDDRPTLKIKTFLGDTFTGSALARGSTQKF